MLVGPWFDWGIILSLIFGGCCSNAFYLEQCTALIRDSGTLLTFATFVFISLAFLPSQLTVPAWHDGSLSKSSKAGKNTRLIDYVPRLQKTAVPLDRWAGQVVLYTGTNLLNNVAFAFDVPMSVHIIFRSGGLVINMILGMTIQGKKYNPLQVGSVLIVTGGVILATLAASGGGKGKESWSKTSSDSLSSSSQYFVGVAMLFVSLVVSGFMGVWQEETFRRHGSAHWKEALFYSHFLSIPLFLIRFPHLLVEIREANQTPLTDLKALLTSPVAKAPNVTWVNHIFGGAGMASRTAARSIFSVPSFYILVGLYAITQLICISGVNRLTTRVSSVGVTLTLSVRKAVSLAISIYFASPEKRAKQRIDLLWAGAAAVLIGTMGYARGSSKPKKVEDDDKPPPPPPKDKSSAPATNGRYSLRNRKQAA